MYSKNKMKHLSLKCKKNPWFLVAYFFYGLISYVVGFCFLLFSQMINETLGKIYVNFANKP
jgi:hypothetical protein